MWTKGLVTLACLVVWVSCLLIARRLLLSRTATKNAWKWPPTMPLSATFAASSGVAGAISGALAALFLDCVHTQEILVIGLVLFACAPAVTVSVLLPLRPGVCSESRSVTRRLELWIGVAASIPYVMAFFALALFRCFGSR